MKAINNYLLIVLCLLFCPEVFVQAQVTITYMDNKKQFELGEPIILYVKIRNNTDSVIGLCKTPNLSVYSFTHSLPGDSLWHDPLTGRFIRERSLHSFLPADRIRKLNSPFCPINSNWAFMIDPGKELVYPMLINECFLIDNVGCQGRYDFLLPKGAYRFDVKFVFTDHQIYGGVYEFDIIETSVDFNQHLEKYVSVSQSYLNNNIFNSAIVDGKKFDADNSDPLYEYIHESNDIELTAKALILLSKYYDFNEWTMYWFLDVMRKADDMLLYYLINKIVSSELILYKDKTETLKIYDTLLQSLKNRKRTYSEYLLERIRVNLQYSDNERYRKDPYSISVDDLKKLKMYSKR